MRRGTAGALCTVAALGASLPLMPRAAWASSNLCNQPSVSSLSQSHGPAGTTVTINGSGFSPGICQLTVNVGPYSVPSPSTDGSHISFTTAAGWSGPVSVTLSGSDGSNQDSHLVYVTDPRFDGLDSSRPLTGATVHMAGAGFQFHLPSGVEQTAAAYRWTAGPGGSCAGAPSSAPAVSDDSHISLQMPSQFCDGAVDVFLTAPSDMSQPSSSPIVFKLTAAFDIQPNVTGMSRTSAVPGQTVTVSGTGFGNQGGTATVGGAPATVQSWGDGGVTVVVPSSATSGAVSFARSVDGQQFAAPQSLTVSGAVSQVSPSQAAVGDTVTVSGAGFGAQAGGVSIAGTAASVQQWSPSTIVFTVPDGVPPGGTAIAIITSGTSAPPAPSFTVLPKITGITPGHAAPGAIVEIDGTSFGTQQGVVTAGGQEATVTVWGDRSVVVSLPAGLSQGSTNVTLTPPAMSSGASFPYSIDAPSASGGRSGGSGSSGGGSGSGGSSPVPGASGAQVAANGLILPSASGPIIAHGPVQFTKPAPPPGPVQLHLDAPATQGDPGASVPFTVTLTAFGKPVVGAPVDLLLVIEPGSDATLNPAHGVTDANGKLTGTIHLSKTPGDHIVLARSGIYSDEVRVVARGANATVASGRAGAFGDGGSAMPSLVSVRSPVLWALIACLLLFGAGFGLNLVTAPAFGGAPGSAADAGRQRSTREALGEGVAAAGSLLRFGASLVALLGASALGALRRR